MASSNPPPESHDALQQYLDQKLKDLYHKVSNHKLIPWMINCNTLLLPLVLTPCHLLLLVDLLLQPMPHPCLHWIPAFDQRDQWQNFVPPIMAHGCAPHHYLRRKLQPRVPPPPCHGVDPRLHIGGFLPHLHNRPAPHPLTGDNHPYIDDVPLFGTKVFDGDVEEDVQAVTLQVATPPLWPPSSPMGESIKVRDSRVPWDT